MTATFRAAANGGGTAGTGARSVSLAALAGDHVVVFGNFSGVISATPVCTDDAGGTYTRLFALPWGVGNGFATWVRDSLVAANATLVITVNEVNTSGEMHALAHSGMLRAGTTSIRSSGTQSAQVGGTPAPTLNQAARTENPTIAAVASDDTTTTPPATHNERLDTNQATPTVALESCSLDSGFTGTAITYGAAVVTNWAAVALELESPLLLDPPLIASAEQLFAPSIATAIDAPLIASAEQLFAPSIATTLDAPLIASVSQLFAPVLFDPNVAAGDDGGAAAAAVAVAVVFRHRR